MNHFDLEAAQLSAQAAGEPITDNDDGLDAKLASDRVIDPVIADLSDLAMTFEDACERLLAMVPQNMTITLSREFRRFCTGRMETTYFAWIGTKDLELSQHANLSTPAEAVAFVAGVLRSVGGAA